MEGSSKGLIEDGWKVRVEFVAEGSRRNRLKGQMQSKGTVFETLCKRNGKCRVWSQTLI